jgi:hypothetical protein
MKFIGMDEIMIGKGRHAAPDVILFVCGGMDLLPPILTVMMIICFYGGIVVRTASV